MEKNEPNADEDLSKPIVLNLPKQSKRRKIWNHWTWWRPLTKKEGGDFALMILKLSEAILNMERVQKKLIKNNNAIIRQLVGQNMVDAEKGEATEKSAKKISRDDCMFG